jgi:hypothetical protein
MSQNNQRRVVKEDAPVMRSVRIQSAAPSLAPPSMPFGVSVAPTKIAPKTQISSAPAPRSLVDKAWKVSQLRPLPTFYKLERTHLKIDDAPAAEIASRIAACLRQESVFAIFNDEEVRVLMPSSPDHDLLEISR